MGGTFSPMGNNNLASLLHGPFSPFVSRLTRVDLFGPKSKIGCAEALCLAALYAVPGMGSFQLTIRGVSQRCLSLGTEGRATTTPASSRRFRCCPTGTPSSMICGPSGLRIVLLGGVAPEG